MTSLVTASAATPARPTRDTRLGCPPGYSAAVMLRRAVIGSVCLAAFGAPASAQARAVAEGPGPLRVVAPGQERPLPAAGGSWGLVNRDIAPPVIRSLVSLPRVVVGQGRWVSVRAPFEADSGDAKVLRPVAVARSGVLVVRQVPLPSRIEGGFLRFRVSGPAGIVIVSMSDAADRGTISGRVLVRTAPLARCRAWTGQLGLTDPASARSGALERLLRVRCASPYGLERR